MIDLTVDPAIAAITGSGAALLFGGAAWHKFRAPEQFDATFAAYRLLDRVRRWRLPRLLPVVEAAVASGMLLTSWRPVAAGAGVVLLLVYSAAIAINLSRGRRDLACGCGGPHDRRRIAPWMVWRNVIVASALLVLMLPLGTRPLGATDAVTIAFGTATMALVYLCIDELLGRTGRQGAGAGALS
jgi:Methylamine utilisation protein MauE